MTEAELSRRVEDILNGHTRHLLLSTSEHPDKHESLGAILAAFREFLGSAETVERVAEANYAEWHKATWQGFERAYWPGLAESTREHFRTAARIDIAAILPEPDGEVGG